MATQARRAIEAHYFPRESRPEKMALLAPAAYFDTRSYGKMAGMESKPWSRPGVAMQDDTFHYPPELMQLLIDTIPLLCRSKRDVLLFFRGAGIRDDVTGELAERVRRDRDSVTKYEIVRTVLTRLNERGEGALRERREIVKRVVEFEDFSTCWDTDRLKAQGLVGQIRGVVNVKDSFTRMRQERERERREHIAQVDKERDATAKQRAALGGVKNDLFGLFAETDPHKRGRALEPILNRLFEASGILVRESFARRGDAGEGIVEQIDGVVVVDGNSYLVEMKWWAKPIGKADVSNHLVNVYHRGQARGIFISASGYTDAAVATVRDGLQRSVFVLCKLEEIVRLLERQESLVGFLRAKIDAAISDKNPLFEPLGP